MLKAKLRRTTTTHSDLPYEGSCAIDEKLLETVDILGNKQVVNWNDNTGEHFTTCAIGAELGSGVTSERRGNRHQCRWRDRSQIQLLNN